MEYKTCNICGISFLANSEFFITDKRNSDGLGAWCRPCSRIKSKESHLRRLDECKKWREDNKEILKVKKHLDYLKNIEKRKEQGKKNYQQNKEQYSIKNKEYRLTHKEQHNESSRRRYQKVKEHHAELTRRWKQEHKEERNIAWQARRAKKLSLECSLTKEQWECCKQYFNNKCCYCGENGKLTQDHFVSLLDNGEYTHNNIVPSCKTCNCSKGNRLFEKWYPRYEHYDKKRERKILKYLNYKNGIQQLSIL